MTRNAINNTRAKLTIDPGLSGDSYTQYSINTTGKYRIGVDDTDSDKFKISSGSALGTNDAYIVTADGYVTKPLQPSFLAGVNELLSNVTGDSTLYTVVFGLEYFDNTSDFDGTSTFTSPRSGKYRLSTGLFYGGLSSGHTSVYVEIVTSNRTYTSIKINPYNCGTTVGSSYQSSFYFSVLADLDAADTVQVKVKVSGSTKTADIGYTSRGYFCGSLIC